MAIEHPFQALFETFGRLPASHAPSVNRPAYQQLWELLSVSPDHPGRCILLRSPRAGHGKTHLLSLLQYHLGAGHEFIPLHAANGYQIDAATVTGDTLGRLGRALPAGAGLTVLDLLVRRLFAQGLQPLVRSGEVPCQDREGALAALRNRPVETFDFHHPNAITAHWAKENFEVLGPRLALELSQQCGQQLRDVTFWIEVFFQFASTPVDHSMRTRQLLQAVSGTESQIFDRLSALLGLFSQLVRIVLVADDLEGFSANETAALRLAAFLGSLRHSAERVDAIISVNKDIWESAFVPRLSAGLADRLAEVVVELQPLEKEDIVALLDARAPGLGDQIYSRIDLSGGAQHARGILRAAADAWTLASTQARNAPAAAIPATQAPEMTKAFTADPAGMVITGNPVERTIPSGVTVPDGHEVKAAEFSHGSEEPATSGGTWPGYSVTGDPREFATISSSDAVPVAVLIPDSEEETSMTAAEPAHAGIGAGAHAHLGGYGSHSSVPPVGHVETPLADILISEAAAAASAHPPVPAGTLVHPAVDGDSPFRISTDPFERASHTQVFDAASQVDFAPAPPAVTTPHGEFSVSRPPAPPTPPVMVEAPPAQATTQAASIAPESDRVDDLLRQFRERYAR